MSAEERSDREDPPALTEAIRLLAMGLWPVPITTPEDRREWVRSPGKQPAAGANWGKERPTETWLRAFYGRNPRCGLGVLLGKEGGVSDLEIDDPATGEDTLLDLFGGEEIATKGWSAHRGRHLLFRWDERLAKFPSVIEGDARFPGLGLRFGSATGEANQFQSVCPPSPTTYQDDGRLAVGPPRVWNGVEVIAELPQLFIERVAQRLGVPTPNPEVNNSEKEEKTGPDSGPDLGSGSGFRVPRDYEPFWDREDILRAVLPRARDLVTEWGLRIIGFRRSKGFLPCRAIDREDRNPSAGWNPDTGVYHDFGTNTSLSLFDLAVALKVYPDFVSACKGLAERFQVPPTSLRYKQNRPRPNDFDAIVPNVPIVPDGTLEWEEPSEAYVEVEAFPLDVLPLSLREFCLAASDTMQTSVDYFAAAALGLAGGVMGRSVCLKITSTWEIMPNLYLAIVGPPGSKKSPALKVMAGPLYEIDRELWDAYKQEKEEWRNADKDLRGLEPAQQHLTLDDTTREAFGKHLGENPRGLVLVKDELTGWVSSLNAYRQGKGDDKQFWMSLNTGSPVKVTRKGSAEPIVVPHPFGAVIGCLTPSTLPQMRESAVDDGWLDRILFAYPEVGTRKRVWSRKEIPAELLDDWRRAIRRLWDRQMVLDEIGGKRRPYFVSLTERGEEQWAAFYNAHQAEQCEHDFPASLVGPWSKLEGFALRLALILSQLHWAYDFADDGRPHHVDELAVWGAGKLIRYFKGHFQRARGELVRGLGSLTPDARAILTWLKSEQKAVFSTRDVTRKFRRFDDQDRQEALDLLVAHHCIRHIGKIRTGQRRGRRKELYETNPKVLKPGSVGDFKADDFGGSSKVDEKTAKAVRCLLALLRDGPQAKSKVLEQAIANGLTPGDMETAAAVLGVEKVDDEGLEYWGLKEQE